MSASPRFAFFDVDDTLIQIKSMFDFFKYWALVVQENPNLLRQFEERFSILRAEGAAREILNREYYRFFAGVWPSELRRAGEAWAKKWLENRNRLFIPAPCAELDRLRMEGVSPVFVSGSFDAVLRPIAKVLNVEHILASKLELDASGKCTGELFGHQTIGKGKAIVIREFLAHHDASSAKCLAFGDDISDLPMLECVGTSIVVGSETALAFEASSRNWTVLETRDSPS